MRSRDTDIVIVPGLGDSGPDHWQTRWQAKLPNAHRVSAVDWDRPDKALVVAAIIATVSRCSRPVVVVAHSLGVVATVEAAFDGMPPLAGAFLVAPPSEAAMGSIAEIDPAFAPIPRDRLGFPSVTVASRTDPYASFEETKRLALDWGSVLVEAGEAGHINADSGHGPWPEGLMAFAGFLSKL